jgi:hypothetical protein
MTNQLNFGNSAELLRANGYVPAACSEGGKPMGPWAVRQHAFHKYPENDPLPVAVLTAVPAPRSEHDPVQNPKATWLATVRVNVRDEVAADVAAVIAKYIGAAKCPVHVADDGSLLCVFRTGELFGSIRTDAWREPDFAHVDAGPSFIPLEGNWRDALDLLDVQRAELPELDHAKGEALISDVNRVLQDHAPPVEPPAPFVPRPLLQPGQRLLYGNTRAMNALREHGFSPSPVRWGQQEVERDGYSDSNGFWHFNCDLSNHGVGVALKGLVTLKSVWGFREDVDAAIRALGPCVIRSVAGDDTRRLYLFRCSYGADEDIYAPNAHIAVRRRGVIVLTGTEKDGREYEWDRDVLTVRADELAAFESHDAQRLRRALESLPPPDYSKVAPAPKRRKAAS